MNTAQRREVRAAEYRERASASRALVDASSLQHVREKHELAAATWSALAAMDERPSSKPAESGDQAGDVSPGLAVDAPRCPETPA